MTDPLTWAYFFEWMVGHWPLIVLLLFLNLKIEVNDNRYGRSVYLKFLMFEFDYTRQRKKPWPDEEERRREP